MLFATARPGLLLSLALAVLASGPRLAAAYTITASAGANGSISPGGSVQVPAGGNQTFNVDPASGYRIASVLVDGVDQGPVCTYTFGSVAANHTIAASFNAPGRYTLTASAGAGGSISPAGPVAVAAGASQTFTIAAASGYRILAVAVDGANQGAIATYTFANVQANHSIAATFASTTQAGKVISIDFAGTGTAMASGDQAGVYPRTHWNQAQGAAQATPQALVDETGAATGATVAWKASGSWNLPGSPGTGDARMMSGYLDTWGANTTVTVAGLPANAGGYSVLVYADGDNGSATRSGVYQISGSGITTASIKLIDPTGANFAGNYAQANGTNGNYVVFNLNATGFTLTAIPSTSSDAYPRAPVNGIQIVPK